MTTSREKETETEREWERDANGVVEWEMRKDDETPEWSRNLQSNHIAAEALHQPNQILVLLVAHIEEEGRDHAGGRALLGHAAMEDEDAERATQHAERARLNLAPMEHTKRDLGRRAKRCGA